MATLLVEHPVFLEHLVPPGHPERPARLDAIRDRLAGPAFARLVRTLAPEATEADVLSVHPATEVAAIRDTIPAEGLARIDSDTFVSPKSLEAALRGAGAACLAADEVLSGAVDNAFCAVRPPGHHAEPGRAMGFCLFNSVAIAARHAQRTHGVGRVAIVDWDVHHGNGTQAAFWSDPSVLYASTHQAPLYPMTGAESETGVGNIVNVPLKAGTKGDVYRATFDARIVPAIERFQPELILISAGFDAHWRDPLAGLALTAEDFGWATTRLRELADRFAGGRIVSVLEGGYDLEGLSESVGAHVAALMA
ncbi:MAG: histone deacetylase family protein [Bauldia sp.]|nr:histone deacetylase family protein [Bauldia sp.]